MIFRTTIPLKNGKSCTLRSAEPGDAEAFVHYSLQLRGETDFLCAGPEEAEHDPQKEALRLELDVVAENEKAIRLYKKFGFVEFGRNPLGFRCSDGKWQELIMMRLELGNP